MLFLTVQFPSIAEYENEEIPKMYLTEELPLDTSTDECSERENHMTDNYREFTLSVITAREISQLSHTHSLMMLGNPAKVP